MKNTFPALCMLLLLGACKAPQDSENDKYDPAKTYRLRLNLLPGSSYDYEISNETVIEAELEEKVVENTNRAELGFHYLVKNDSAGNSLLSMTFNRIHLYKKNGELETELDAANAAFATDPTEKMLGLLKGSEIVTTINERGEVLAVAGMEEIPGKIMSAFPQTDDKTKMAIETEWQKTVENGLVKNSMEQLFKVFPDSAIHLGDKWSLKSKQTADIPMTVIGHYQLKAINSDIAIIESEGQINGSNAMTLQGTGSVMAQLTGDQQGIFEMETRTGMLISGKVKASISGTIQVMGRDVPVKIKTTVSIKGKRGR